MENLENAQKMNGSPLAKGHRFRRMVVLKTHHFPGGKISFFGVTGVCRKSRAEPSCRSFCWSLPLALSSRSILYRHDGWMVRLKKKHRCHTVEIKAGDRGGWDDIRRYIYGLHIAHYGFSLFMECPKMQYLIYY